MIKQDLFQEIWFNDLPDSALFVVESRYFIRTEDIVLENGNIVNCVDLQNGKHLYMDNIWVIMLLNVNLEYKYGI
jgi:hypothetical protein